MTDPLEGLKSALADRYRVEREIGRGGTALVYLAEDLRHRRHVAIKVLRPELATTLGSERFLLEIRITAHLVHPNILPLLDSGVAGEFLYYVMPYVPGESLRDRIGRERQLPVKEALQITREIADALAYAHGQDVVHRDIKPENILFESGHAVVADFGIARALTAAGGERLTSTGFSVGTPAYMSPEQIFGAEAIDGRSDLYSVATVLYEMLAGEPPYTGPTPQAVMARRTVDPVPSLRAVRDTVPVPVEEAVVKALGKAPADRFDTVADFAAALAPHSLSAPRQTAVEAPRRLVRSRRVWLTMAGMAAVAVGIGLFTPSRAVPFEKRDWILIADVENSTGDTLFDRSLDMALTIAIQQSQHVNVYPRPRVEETLRRMGRDSVDGLSEPLAREIAERENLPVVVVPSISRLDSVYLLGIRLVDPVTGVDLSSRSDRAIGANEVLSSLDRLARRLRRDLGESRRSLSRLGRQLPQVTTASLEALKAWAAGLQPGTSWEHAGRLWLRAIELDSNFAMAHNSLGLFYYWAQSDRLRGDKHFEKALSLSDRVTERERMLIQANAASWRGNREEAVEVYEIYLRQYPDDATTWHDLGYSRMMLGRSAEALDAFANVLELDSSSSDAYINIATIHAAEGRMAEAVPYYLRAFELQPDYRLVANINHEFGFNYAELGDFEAAEDVFNLAISDPRGDRARGLRSLALLRMFVGKYAEAAQFLEQSIVLNQTTAPGVSEMRDRLFLVMALSTAGATEALKRALEDAYARFRAVYLPPEWLQDWGMLFARNGYLERAEEVVDSAEARADPDNRDDVVALHLLRGEVALARGAYEEATDHFERARALEARTTRHQERLARSYLLKGDLDRAREWYEQILAVRSLGHEGQETWVLAHYQLGRIFEEQGDTTNALDCYGRLLGIWEEADSDIPLLLDTRRRVTQLQLPR